MAKITRRDLLRTLSLAGIAVPALGNSFKVKQIEIEANPGPDPRHIAINQPVTCIVIGAGARGNIYAGYATAHANEMKIVGVAEPIPERNERMTKKFGIEENHRFKTWEHVFDVPKFADVCIITTPDNLHYGPAMKALEMGYDLLLEKPIAQTWEQCNDILKMAKKHNRIVAVCHVLRYSPYFRKLKQLVDDQVIGQVISMQHMEPIQHIHMSHSYVRGNWRKESETNPIILAKSCHDLDIMRWLIGKPARKVASFGSLTWFREANAPVGSTARCTDGCAVEATCQYSALEIYYRKRTWLSHMVLPTEGDQGPAIMDALKNGRFGRCVYRCDNDVLDHQIVALEFEGGVTANFNMEAHTNYAGRRTRIMGSHGDIVGDEDEIIIADFVKKEVTRWYTKDNANINSGHGGGDYGLTGDFLQAVVQRDQSLLTSNLDASMESHLMGFQAEIARKQGIVANIKL